jgi:hypothetical protein
MKGRYRIFSAAVSRLPRGSVHWDFTIVFPTTEILADVRSAFGDRFVLSRVEAEREAAALLNARAGEMTREDAFKLGELFNRHEKSGRVRQDRFLPGFAGATVQKLRKTSSGSS